MLSDVETGREWVILGVSLMPHLVQSRNAGHTLCSGRLIALDDALGYQTTC